jgi:hypothetical protein
VSDEHDARNSSVIATLGGRRNTPDWGNTYRIGHVDNDYKHNLYIHLDGYRTP